MIVGIEGPVLAGKSSLVHDLVETLTQLGVSVVSCPCYVETVKRLGREIPPGLPGSAREQQRALRFFLEIDRLRRPPRRSEVVLLDRTTWTLEAHAAALVSTGAIEGPVDVDEPIRRAIHELRPDTLVYLDASWEVQLQRAPSRDGLPPPFLDRQFNAEFRRFFEATASEHQALWLDATRPLPATVGSVVHYLRRIGDSHGPPQQPPARCRDDANPGTESFRSSPV